MTISKHIKSIWPLFSMFAFLLSTSAEAQNKPLGLPVQISHSYNLDNSLSPDGSRMVYVSFFEDRQQLFIMDADGRNIQQITFEEAEHFDPAWSPEGNLIAYVKQIDDVNTIHILDLNDNTMRALPAADKRPIHPIWTLDSRKLIYNTDDDLEPPFKNASEINSIDIASGEIETLIANETSTYPALSPDGKKLAFRRMVGVNSEVFIANADGTEERNITKHPAFDGWPEWSPDGKQIAFASNRNSAYQIFIMDADGSNVHLVANNEGRATVPRWSRDGRVIYYTNCRNVSLRRACEIYAVHLDGWKPS